MMRRLTTVVLALASLALSGTRSRAGEGEDPPPVAREFRAAWIATVSNIDWPSRPGLPTRRQKRELRALLDAAVDMRLNAVILQIRPAADAMYKSSIEPWSEYLTGKMGQAPSPAYDPLRFAVREAHQRGLQLHVWFNPYRVRMTDAKSPATSDHASVANGDIVRDYGKFKWFDPGEPAAADRFIDVLVDVTKRYDIDGVHIDDYFYPYPIAVDGKNIPFPDDASYAKARAAGETLERDDWRRQNCDRLIERMYAEVKKTKPWVLVGVSPFGIWRPGHPEGIAGLDQYATLYADARKWLREGWVDYFTPQLYWRIEGPQSYPKLLAWWQDENVKGRHLWPGNGAHNVRRDSSVEPGRSSWPAEELLSQIDLTREIVTEGPGNVYFSMKCLVDNRDGLRDKLTTGQYAAPALVPESPWLGEEEPAEFEAKVREDGDELELTLTPKSDEAPWLWVVRLKQYGQWSTQIVPGSQTVSRIAGQGVEADNLRVSAVTRLGREGKAIVAELSGAP
jgi:uncharacterized lipoprotein YddW (UPF0748 family)